MHDELSVLAPEGASIEYSGERLEVRPLTIGQIPPLVRKCRAVVDALMGMADLDKASEEQQFKAMFDVVGDQGEQVLEAVALAIGKPVAFVASGSLEDFERLAMKVLEVNRDFFVQRLGPLLGALKKQNAGAGPTPPSS